MVNCAYVRCSSFSEAIEKRLPFTAPAGNEWRRTIAHSSRNNEEKPA